MEGGGGELWRGVENMGDDGGEYGDGIPAISYLG